MATGIPDRPFKLTLVRRTQQVQFFMEVLQEELGIEMMRIPEGKFLMGSPQDELDRYDGESPRHEVNVSSFFMGKYPVTQAQWRFVAGLTPVRQELKPDPSYFKGNLRPVESVNWWDAVEFCDRLSQYTGREYRLPSEAEWEYACRAGTTTPFHFGETITTDLANYCGVDGGTSYKGFYGRGLKGEYREETTPVDHFGIANAFGLCEMHGNVWEWCLDHWHESYEGAPEDGSAWLSQDENSSRVLRGGSWHNYPGDCRSATRYGINPAFDYNDLGFRVVCVVPRTL
jgi:formylglycine-generating enzyme required for sulfatase activity